MFYKNALSYRITNDVLKSTDKFLSTANKQNQQLTYTDHVHITFQMTGTEITQLPFTYILKVC